jgi:phosphoglycolate phosphatase-like HAD superfamily hydrolase
MARDIWDYRAVLFDCDDTILETSKSRWHVMIETAARFDCPDLTPDRIRAFWGEPFDKMIPLLLPGVDYGQFVSAYRAAMRMQEHRPTPTPGALPLLDFLERRSIKMCIVSSGSRELVDQDLEALGMRDFFERIYGCEDTDYHKPDSRALEPAIKHLKPRHTFGVIPCDVVYIGDSVRDYKASSGYRVDFIGVTSGIESETDLYNAGAERIVERLDSLIPGGAAP